MRRLASYSLARGTPKSGAQNCTFSRRFTLEMGSFVVSVAAPRRLASLLFFGSWNAKKWRAKLHIFTKVYNNLPGKLEMGSFVVSVAAPLWRRTAPRESVRARQPRVERERLRASPPPRARVERGKSHGRNLAALEPRAATQVYEFEYLLVPVRLK